MLFGQPTVLFVCRWERSVLVGKLLSFDFYQKPIRVETCNGPLLENKLLNIQFAKYHIWNNKSKGFPNMVLSPETFNQSVRTEYSEAVNARYTFQPLWVSVSIKRLFTLSVRFGFQSPITYFWVEYNYNETWTMGLKNWGLRFRIALLQKTALFNRDDHAGFGKSTWLWPLGTLGHLLLLASLGYMPPTPA